MAATSKRDHEVAMTDHQVKNAAVHMHTASMETHLHCSFLTDRPALEFSTVRLHWRFR
jgi:hypothetical protein